MRPRWLYISLFIILASTGRFLAVVLQDLGLTDSQIGLSLALGIASGAASTPYFSRRADEKGTLPVLKELTILHLLTGCLLIPVPYLDLQYRFPMVIVWRITSAVFLTPTGSVLDAYALRILISSKHKSRYGEERLWGAVSWAVANVFMGILMDLLFEPNRSLQVSGGFLLFGSLWLLRLIRNSPPTPLTQDPTAKNTKMEASVVNFLKSTLDRQVGAFFLMVFALGAGMALVEKLLFLFLVDELHASRFVCGLSVLITVAMEIPLFWFSEKMVQNASYVNLYLIAVIAYTSRVLAYTLIHTSWGVLAVEPLHGITIACAQTAGVLFMSDRAPVGMEATAQGIFSFLRSMGSLIGTLVGSIVLENFGSAVMYRSASFFVGLCGLVLFVAFRLPRSAYGDMGGIEFEPIVAMNNDNNNGSSRIVVEEENRPLSTEITIDTLNGDDILSVDKKVHYNEDNNSDRQIVSDDEEVGIMKNMR